MKIFVTSFIWDGTEHAGPNIFAENEKVAEAIAEYQGLIIDGELKEIYGEELLKEINEKRVIH
jgi:hypothetical protein|tara:strand:+ start:860 stop:1048 length:189 start_codon:yes stop_codon:yes gene_type:complete